MVRIVDMSVRVFVQEPLLRESFVRSFEVFHGRTIALLEERMDKALRLPPVVLWACERRGWYGGDEGGFAAFVAVFFEDYLSD